MHGSLSYPTCCFIAPTCAYIDRVKLISYPRKEYCLFRIAITIPKYDVLLVWTFDCSELSCCKVCSTEFVRNLNLLIICVFRTAFPVYILLLWVNTIMWQILEKMADNHDTYHLFINFKATYDSIARVKLYDDMSSFGIPAKLIRLVRMTMINVTCQVRVVGKLSGPFATTKGLRQGNGLACLLFNMALERAIRDSRVETTGTIFYEWCSRKNWTQIVRENICAILKDRKILSI